MEQIEVNVDNFARAETDRMFAAILKDSGGINRWMVNRQPTPLDKQPIIRQNRDTLYSGAVVDISQGATLAVPESGDRYVSVMVVNQDHYINEIYHDPGSYHLTIDDFATPFVLVGVRILVDPSDPDDVAAVNALQDKFILNAPSDRPFVMPDYDESSLTAVRQALLTLARGSTGFQQAFGRREDVNPIHHLVATAAGPARGGLPDQEARYLSVDTGLPVGEYQITVRDVPVDAFWSISVYNASGYFEPNDRDANSLNSITAATNDDGSITIRFGGCDDDRPNCLPITDGWNYLVRLYRPRREILDGSWTFPPIDPM